MSIFLETIKYTRNKKLLKNNNKSIKAACLQMSQNISIKSNLRNKYYDFSKSKIIQDSSNILHVMCG
jgi:hypothetical protein